MIRICDASVGSLEGAAGRPRAGADLAWVVGSESKPAFPAGRRSARLPDPSQIHQIAHSHSTALVTSRAEVVPVHEEEMRDLVNESIAEEIGESVGACDLGWEWYGGWFTDRLTLSGVDAPWVEREEAADIWDAETAARAEEEMRLASAARLGLC